MWKSFRIGSIAGIPLKLDITFLLILPLFAWIIGSSVTDVVELLNVTLDSGIDPEPLTEGSTEWILGFAAAIGLFVGVLLHELGHALTARRYGYPIDSITLWLLGGIASFSELPEDWRQEFGIAIAGPIVSVLVGIASFLIVLVIPDVLSGAGATTVDGAVFVFSYLAVLNVFLAMFNLVPAFPMDGGRVLRALLGRNRPFAQATQQAASVGRAFAVFFGLIGLLMFNIVLIGIAFFIYIAASGEERQVLLKAAFADVTIADIMTPRADLKTVSPSESVQQLTQRMFRERHTGYPVVEDGDLVGIVTLDDMQDVPQEARASRTVRDIMNEELPTIDSRADAMDAIERMQQDSIGRLLVVDDGHLAGIISRTDVMTAMEIMQQQGPFRRTPEVVPSD